MVKVSFVVSAPCLPEDQLKIVGSHSALGCWDPLRGLLLNMATLDEWHGSVTIEKNTRLEFKLIRLTHQQTIEWQTLPRNANRKFKPKYNCKLLIRWSEPEGRIVNQNKTSGKQKEGKGMVKQKELPMTQLMEFDPYQIAMQDNSDDSDQEQFTFSKRKKSADIKLNKNDFEQLYYDSTEVQLNSCMKKHMIYLICQSSYNPQLPFFCELEKQLSQVQNYSIKLCILSSETEDAYNNLKEKIETVSNACRYSLFVFLDIESALMVCRKNIMGCLYLAEGQFDNLINKINLLEEFKLICFEDEVSNQKFQEYWLERKKEEIGEKARNKQTIEIVGKRITIVNIVNKLAAMNFSKETANHKMVTITQADALKLIATNNSIIIIDGDIQKSYPQLLSKIVSLRSQNTMIVLLCDKISKQLQVYRKSDNIVIVSQHFSKAYLEGKQYECLRKHLQVLGFLRVKGKFYNEIHGAEILEKDSSIVYTLREESFAERVEKECVNLLKSNDYFKVSRRGNKVRIGWSLALEIRLLRTICKIKYINTGPLGNFSMITAGRNMEQLKEQLEMLVEHRVKYFEKGSDTRINYFAVEADVANAWKIVLG